MSGDLVEHRELANWLDALFDERISESEFAQLEQHLASSARARSFYLEYVQIHGTLLWQGPGLAVPAVLPVRSTDVKPAVLPAATPRPVARRAWAWAAPVTAAAVLLLLLGYGFNQPFTDAPPRVVSGATPVLGGGLAAPSLSAELRPLRRPLELVGVGPAEDEAPSSSDSTLSGTIPVAEIVPAEVADAEVVQLIDDELARTWRDYGVTPAPPADDLTWLRRITLDLLGRIPTIAEAERFQNDRNLRKRRNAVDRLLNDPRHPYRLASTWTQLLVGRKPADTVDREALHQFLRVSFAQQRGWSDIVAELLSAEGKTDQSGAVNFLVAHVGNQAVPATARTASLFLGEQLHCVQCHNHPFNSTQQERFWELQSFFDRTEVVVRHAERQRTEVELVSQPVSGPAYFETPRGLMKVAYPRFANIEVDPGDHVHRRRELVRLLKQGDPPQLAVAFVNRMWSHLFGYGFVNPVDDLGEHNPASHPKLLNGLATAFARNGYDVKSLERWICLSQAYGAAAVGQVGDVIDDPQVSAIPLFSRAYVRPLSPEQVYDSLLTASHVHELGRADWQHAMADREAWQSEFVVAMENDENEEFTTFEGSLAQALTLMNSDLIQKATSDRPGSLLDQVQSGRKSDAQCLQQASLAVLSRSPTADELRRWQTQLRQARARSGEREFYQDLLWALLNSNEFSLIR